ncbi:adhesion G protein-coupled receptor E3-like, partial [Emydura macquarii macquarii]|uniref:adhesion G protein-coupled receptor E3-like n=1 Tax=Emydura macquarii macquarii TaxID=1129001 RepID=UPI00352B0A66
MAQGSTRHHTTSSVLKKKRQSADTPLRHRLAPPGTSESCSNHLSHLPNAKCVNSTHSTCRDGYQPSGNPIFSDPTASCDDINECLGPSRADCGANTHCTNTPGSYYCHCVEGYESSSGKATFRSASENTCRDIDECLEPSRADCGPHSHCTNVAGSYYCSCINGYESSPGKATFRGVSENTCQDIDECLGPSRAHCGPHTNCTNMPGSYYCSCIDGYESSSGKATFRSASENTCRDINECSRSSDICGPGALCSNTGGSFQCRCPAGLIPSTGVGSWVLNQTTCKDPCYNSSAELERIKERRRNCPLQGELSSSSSFCSFLNSTLEILTSTCGAGSAALSLEGEIRTFSAIMNNTSVWDSMSEGEVASAVDVLLQSVEEAALATARRSPGRMTQNVTTESMAVQTRLITGNCSQDSEVFRLSAHRETMDVHCNTVTGAATQAGLTAAVAFISYSTLGSIINRRLLSQGNPPAGGTLGNSHLNSRVVSGAVGGRRPIHLSRPANFTLYHSQDIQAKEESLCVYWKFVGGEGTWSRDGCTVLHANSTHTTCSCNHLSSFALLMAPTAVTESYTLTVVTYVALTLSLLCLLFAILTFLLCRSIRNVSTSIHLQLCLCLFLADLLFLTAVTRTSSRLVCAVIAGFLHYLFLACFTWMFLEGLHLFLTVRNLKVVNYTSTGRFKKRYMYPLGYGFPALVVAISAALNPEGYGSPQYCWLSQEKGFHWSFLGPVCVIILINTTFFALILWILRNKLSTLNTDVSILRDHRLLTFKAIAQLFILGCTWILGLLQVGPAATVMEYLFTIINSLQGAFIFLVHCLLNRQVREEYRGWIKRVRTFGTESQMYDVSMSTLRTADTKTLLSLVSEGPE